MRTVHGRIRVEVVAPSDTGMLHVDADGHVVSKYRLNPLGVFLLPDPAEPHFDRLEFGPTPGRTPRSVTITVVPENVRSDRLIIFYGCGETCSS